jgi:hypothetical protein
VECVRKYGAAGADFDAKQSPRCYSERVGAGE